MTTFDGQIKGGTKAKFLNDNRNFILNYLELFGKEDTMAKFNLQYDTLESLLFKGSAPQRNIVKDRFERVELKAQIATVAVEELKAEIRDLKSQFEDFQASVALQLVNKIFKPLMQQIQLPAGLELRPGKDLSLEDIEFMQETLLTITPARVAAVKSKGSLDGPDSHLI